MLYFAAIIGCFLFTLVQSRPSELGIIGGEDVKIEDFSDQVSVRFANAHICGGTLVGDKWVLTTASCVDGYPLELLSILEGSANRTNSKNVILPELVLLDPSYNSSTLAYDVAVLKLKDVASSKPIPAIAAETDSPNSTIALTVTGWGAIKEDDGPSVILKKVDLMLETDDKCTEIYKNAYVKDCMLCTVVTNTTDTCFGDTGGPLRQDGILYGLVSWGVGCGRPNYPRVFTKISSVRKFIDEAMKK